MLGLASLVGPLVDKFVDRIPNGNERARAKEQLEQGLVDAANEVMASFHWLGLWCWYLLVYGGSTCMSVGCKYVW